MKTTMVSVVLVLVGCGSGEVFAPITQMDGPEESGSPRDNSIAVRGDDAALGAVDYPAALECGGSYLARLTLQNAGSTTWTHDKEYGLYPPTGPDPLLPGFTGSGLLLPVTEVAPGEELTFVVQLTGPVTPGRYSSAWQMGSVAGGFFGEVIAREVEVSCDGPSGPVDPVEPPTSSLSAEIVSVELPSEVVCGVTYPARVEIENTGDVPWSPSDIGLKMVYDFLPFAQGIDGTVLPFVGNFPVTPGGSAVFDFGFFNVSDSVESSAVLQLYSNTHGYFGPRIDEPIRGACGSAPPRVMNGGDLPCSENEICQSLPPGPIGRLNISIHHLCSNFPDPSSCRNIQWDGAIGILHPGDTLDLDSTQRNGVNICQWENNGPSWTVTDPNGVTTLKGYPNDFGARIKPSAPTRLTAQAKIYSGGRWVYSDVMTFEVRPR